MLFSGKASRRIARISEATDAFSTSIAELVGKTERTVSIVDSGSSATQVLAAASASVDKKSDELEQLTERFKV